MHFYKLFHSVYLSNHLSPSYHGSTKYNYQDAVRCWGHWPPSRSGSPQFKLPLHLPALGFPLRNHFHSPLQLYKFCIPFSNLVIVSFTL